MTDSLTIAATFVLGVTAFMFLVWYVHWDSDRLQRRWDAYRFKHYPDLTPEEALDRYLWDGSPWY